MIEHLNGAKCTIVARMSCKFLFQDAPSQLKQMAKDVRTVWVSETISTLFNTTTTELAIENAYTTPPASPSEENLAIGSVNSRKDTAPIANEEEFWGLLDELDSSLAVKKSCLGYCKRIVFYLRHNDALFAKYKERRDYMRVALYDKIKVIMGSPWELKIYRGSRAIKDGQLRASLKYKSYPHISSLWVIMDVKTDLEELDDVKLTIKCNPWGRHMGRHMGEEDVD